MIWKKMSPPKPKCLQYSDIEALKEKHCLTAQKSYAQTMESLDDFSLPAKTDFHDVRLDEERFEIPEMFFLPAQFGATIQQHLRKLLELYYFPVVICGGSSMFPGIRQGD